MNPGGPSTKKAAIFCTPPHSHRYLLYPQIKFNAVKSIPKKMLAVKAELRSSEP